MTEPRTGTGGAPDPPGAERESVALDGLWLSYLVAGDPSAPPVVLLHGGGLDSAAVSWRDLLPALADDYRVYAPDWPGYGESDPPDGVPGVPYHVAVAARFLDALGLDEPAVAGVSLGGGAALGLALDRPDRVRRIVPVDSYGLGGSVPGGPLGALAVRVPYVSGASFALLGRSRWLTEQSVRAVVAPGNASERLVDDVFAELGRPRAGEAWNAFQRAEVGWRGLRTNYVERLPDLSVPALFVHGERDALVPVAWAVRAAHLAPDAEVRVLAGCGHWAPRERPEPVASLLAEFLSPS